MAKKKKDKKGIINKKNIIILISVLVAIMVMIVLALTFDKPIEEINDTATGTPEVVEEVTYKYFVSAVCDGQATNGFLENKEILDTEEKIRKFDADLSVNGIPCLLISFEEVK